MTHIKYKASKYLSRIVDINENGWKCDEHADLNVTEKRTSEEL